MTGLQLSMFDAPTPAALPEPKIRLRRLTGQDLAAARKLADAGLSRAVASTAVHDPEWSDKALAAFLAYGEKHGGTFSTEDVRHSSPDLPAPRSATAWGAIPRRAVRLGKVEHGGWAPSKDPKSHGAPGNVWRWIG